MSLLTIAQDASDLIGITKPTVIVGSTDAQARQLLALANIEGQSLYKRTTWTALIKELTHTTLAAEDQGTIASLMPDFAWVINDTVWDRTNQNFLGGPADPVEWQERETRNFSGPYYKYRIKAGHLYFNPAPPAGHTVALEYGSKNWCQSADGTGQSRWAADTDTGVLDEGLMTLGVRWRFLQAKGMDYGEAFSSYELEVAQAMTRDGAKPTLNLGGAVMSPFGSVRAPDGSWSV